MEEQKVYLVYVETGDYYDTHNVKYAGLNFERAKEIILSKDDKYSSDYIEVWMGEKYETTIWAHELRGEP